jgi:hypothetical protein
MASMKPLPQTGEPITVTGPVKHMSASVFPLSPANHHAPAFGEHLPGQAITNSTSQRCDHAQRLQLDAATARDPPFGAATAGVATINSGVQNR